MSRSRLPMERKLSILVGIITVLFFAYWVHLEGSFQDHRDLARSAGHSRATQVATVLDHEFETTFRAVDRFLQGLGQEHHTAGQEFEAAAKHVLPLFPLPCKTRVSLYAPDGSLQSSTAPAAAESTFILPSGTDVLSTPGTDESPLIVLAPRDNRQAGQWELRFARAFVENGKLSGVILAEMPAAFFSAKLSSIGLTSDDYADLVLLPSGVVLASSDPDSLGTKVPSGAPYLGASAPADGVVDTPEEQAPDRAPGAHVLAWSRLHRYPAVTTVSLSDDQILKDVDQHIALSRTYAIVNLGLLSILVAVVVVLILRGERQRRALEQQEALYHGLFEQNHSIKLVSDPQTGQILEANQMACNFYGYSHEQMLSMNISDINCLPRAEINAAMAEALTAKRPFFLFPHRLANGEVRHVEVYSGPVELQGRTMLYSIIHDVTERFELEAKLKASEARYRTVFEVVPAGVVMVDGDGVFAAYNSAALEILTTDEATLRHREKPLFDPMGRKIAEKERPSWRALTSDLHDELFYTISNKGEKVWATFNSRRLPPDMNGKPAGAVIGFSDVSEIMRQEEKLLISQLVFDSTTEGIMVTDAERAIVAVNKSFSEITGYRAEEVIGKQPSLLASGIHDKDFFRAMYESLSSKGSWEGEITNRNKSGQHFIERLVINAVVRPNGLLAGYVGVISDITARKEKEKQLWHQANFDPLTGLPNRTLFLDRAEQALAQSQRRGQPVAILFVDLDRFKPVNDRYGHAVGDELLKAVSARLMSCVRAEDTVGRLGGDEFVVLLPMVADRQSSLFVASKILHALCEPFTIGTIEVSIGCCVGVAVADGDLATIASTLLDAADHAMYRAKANGRGRVEIAA